MIGTETLVDTEPASPEPVPDPVPEAVPAPVSPQPARTAAQSRPALTGVATGLGVLGVLLLGAVVYLFGVASIAENSGQQVMYESFAAELSQAVAPVGPADHGTPVAILRIPQMSLDNTVVVSGTTGADLTHGPGLRRDTVLPGQPGVSVIYGRSTTFGAPFGRLGKLHRGDRFTVITGQGEATYVVNSFGNHGRPPASTSPNRLVLTTVAKNTNSTISVSADLVSPPQPVPGGARPGIGPAERGAGIDTDALVPLLLWTQALVLIMIAAVLGRRHWQTWPALACLAPIALAVLWNVYENAAILLPNLF